MLADDIARALAELRVEAGARMTSRVTVRRESGTAPGVDGFDVITWADIYTDLPFRLDGSSSGDGGSRTEQVGGVEYETATAVGHVPHDTTNLRADDLLLITSGEWSGSVFRIVGTPIADQKTARRFPVEEVAAPEEWS